MAMPHPPQPQTVPNQFEPYYRGDYRPRKLTLGALASNLRILANAASQQGSTDPQLQNSYIEQQPLFSGIRCDCRSISMEAPHGQPDDSAHEHAAGDPRRRPAAPCPW